MNNWTFLIITILSISGSFARPSMGVFTYVDIRSDLDSAAKVSEFTVAEKKKDGYLFRFNDGRMMVLDASKYRDAIYYPSIDPTATIEQVKEQLAEYNQFIKKYPASSRYLQPKLPVIQQRVAQLEKATKADLSAENGESEKIPSITLKNGKKYFDVVIREKVAGGIKVMHKSGILTIPMEELPDGLVASIGNSKASPSQKSLDITGNSPESSNSLADNNSSEEKQKSDESNSLASQLGEIADNLEGKDTKGTSKINASKTQQVLAEGVGKDETLALKDAFRNAVQQVVGMVVDATEQVENDEVIRDQILTASNGFISKYETISTKVEDGVTRVRINATVERKTLVEKLQAQQVTLKKEDMNNLFAKVASDTDAVKSTTELLAKRLIEIHESWTYEKGTPSYEKTKGILTIPVTIKVDKDAYKASSTRLVEYLEKIAIAKKAKILASIKMKSPKNESSEFKYHVTFASGKEELAEIKHFNSEASSSVYPISKFWKNYNVSEWLSGEDFGNLPEKSIWIWVCLSANGQSMEWKGYAVEVDLTQVGPLLFPQWSLSMSLRDKQGNALGSWENQNIFLNRELFPTCDPSYDGYGTDQSPQIGLHSHLVSMGDPKYDQSGIGYRAQMTPHPSHDLSYEPLYSDNETSYRFCSLISPCFMSLGKELRKPYPIEGNFVYWFEETIPATFNISPDQLREINTSALEIKAIPREQQK